MKDPLIELHLKNKLLSIRLQYGDIHGIVSWYMLPDDIRTSQSLIAFKRAIRDITV